MHDKQTDLQSRYIKTIRQHVKSTRQDNMLEAVILIGNQSDFFQAPASAKPEYHNCFVGGLAEHCLSVTNIALQLAEPLIGSEFNESIVIAGLFHDLGKTGLFNGKQRIPYYTTRYVETDMVLRTGIQYGYTDTEHGELIKIAVPVSSVLLLQQFVPLTVIEIQAILAHDGQYVPSNKEYAQSEHPLTMILHFADLWSCRVIEKGYDILKFANVFLTPQYER